MGGISVVLKGNLSVEPTKTSNLSADFGLIKALKLTMALICEIQSYSDVND